MAPSFRSLSNVLGDVAAAGAGEIAWPQALEALMTFLSGSTATLFLYRPVDQKMDWIDHCGEFAPGDVYVDHYSKQDVLFPAALRRPPASSIACSQVVDRSDFFRTEFYNDFAKPRDMIDCVHVRLFDDPAESLFLAVTRSHSVGTFNAEDCELIDLLVPHITRAVRSSRHLAALFDQRDTAQAAFAAMRAPLLVVDATLRLYLANPAAERVLISGDPLACRAGRLVARRPADTDGLRRLVVHELAPGNSIGSSRSNPVHPGPALALHRNDGSPLLLHILPLRAGHAANPGTIKAAMIVMVDPNCLDEPSLAHCLRALYGLTPTQARIAVLIGAGIDPGKVAEVLSMKRTTVRWYLQRIFEKTGTVKQTKLVQLVERLGVVNPAA